MEEITGKDPNSIILEERKRDHKKEGHESTDLQATRVDLDSGPWKSERKIKLHGNVKHIPSEVESLINDKAYVPAIMKNAEIACRHFRMAGWEGFVEDRNGKSRRETRGFWVCYVSMVSCPPVLLCHESLIQPFRLPYSRAKLPKPIISWAKWGRGPPWRTRPPIIISCNTTVPEV